MSEAGNTNAPAADRWGSLEPYVQLVRALLPRASGVALFDAGGDLRWSNETPPGPEVRQFVAATIRGAQGQTATAGEFQMLGGNQPTYLCWLRDDEDRVLAILTVVCKAASEQDAKHLAATRSFSFAHSLLRPALECLRRELTSRAAIERLNRTVSTLDKDREVLQADLTLSGLYTRPAFEQRMRAVAEDRSQRRWTALYIDADQLHVINDNFGMHVGDSVLSQLGELIRTRLPPQAFAARISGDRFAVLLPMDLAAAEKFAEGLRERVEQLGTAPGEPRLRVSISIGVAPLDSGDGELMHALAAAETACKAAKDRGRNRVEVYQSNDESLVRRFADINIAAQLREAIDVGRLRLDAQLIAPYARAGVRGYFELLLRMIDENGHAVGFDRLLSAANRYQLMPVIDRWVVEKALALLEPRARMLADMNIGFTINFSGQSLGDAEFADFLVGRLAASSLPAELLCFELTETATVANMAKAAELMQRLRKLGCGVALDDFGTGMSSLSYLRQLPVTMLKIDGSFVRDVLVDERAESMVRAIAQLARTMSIVTVAEYVETREIGARIATLGVDYAQGFGIGKPAPLTDLLAGLQPLAANRGALVGATGLMVAAGTHR
jgi:diguanylate cyclase (GGDEF)-like protein